ncbi:unnamed protein product [Paramecium sonneborni]|uniref:Uncharacterized protein n=1 Tax=Paramecium sonneborni TaxID=65129 RepID=A0A8S1Q7G4_9CILI|nr:unnamed protein product [Paramecium sonneborni]
MEYFLLNYQKYKNVYCSAPNPMMPLVYTMKSSFNSIASQNPKTGFPSRCIDFTQFFKCNKFCQTLNCSYKILVYTQMQSL